MAHGNRLANLSNCSRSALADSFRLRTGLISPTPRISTEYSGMSYLPWRPRHGPRRCRAHTSPQPPAVASATGSSDPIPATPECPLCTVPCRPGSASKPAQNGGSRALHSGGWWTSRNRHVGTGHIMPADGSPRPGGAVCRGWPLGPSHLLDDEMACVADDSGRANTSVPGPACDSLAATVPVR